MDKVIACEDNFTENLKKNAQGEIIEKQAAHPLPHGAKRIYHAISRDCITNEIFRRVEPEGRTMGEYFQQVILPEYGIDTHLRMDPETFSRIADFKDHGIFSSIRNSWKDYGSGRYASVGFWGICSYMSNYTAVSKEVDKTRGAGNRGYMAEEIAGLNGDMGNLRNPSAYQAELVSCTCLASARGLGRLAGFMANKGKIGDQQLISEATWDAMHADPTFSPLLPDGMGSIFTAGGLCYFDLEEIQKHPRNEFFGNKPMTKDLEYQLHAHRKGYYGWVGAGGCILQWHAEKQIGFGYVPSDFMEMDFYNYRGSVLQGVVSQCVDDLNAQQ